jgi:hypothetical protein
MKTDLAKVHSVRLSGSITAGTQQFSLDVRVAKASGEGEVTIGTNRLDIRLLNGTVYLQGTQQGLTAIGAPTTLAAAAAGKWLKGSSSSGGLASFAGFLDLNGISTGLLKPSGTLKTGSTSTIHGAKVFALIDTSTTNGSTLFVAETGRAVPIRIERTGGGGQINFTDYDAKVAVSVPAGAVDISTFGQ